MYKELSRLVIYRDVEESSILFRLGRAFEKLESGKDTKENIRTEIFVQIKRLLEIATKYGFDKNLWQNYLTYFIITDENPFSITYEKAGKQAGSANLFAENDFEIFRRLFHYDFSEIEAALDINCFSVISDYCAIPKREQIYNKSVSEKVRALSERIAAAKSGAEILDTVSEFYKNFGVGMFGLNKAFRISYESGSPTLVPITNMEMVRFEDLVGYELQKNQLIMNTEAFVSSRPANNVLLYGDSGTGKSTSIKAVINKYYDDGLRMIEIYKHQLVDMSSIISQIKNRNYKFIIYMDDLSFEDNETEYKYLKAIIEGGVETKPDNVLIYATSNRRHLVRESFNDRNDTQYTQDVHRSETIEEKLSLVNRFGLTIGYFKPSRTEFDNIVLTLARKRSEIKMSDEEIVAGAHAWELRHGGISGRSAQQYVDFLCGGAK